MKKMMVMALAAFSLAVLAEEKPVALMGTKLDVQTLAADVLQPGRYEYKDLHEKWLDGGEYAKYSVLYFGEKLTGEAKGKGFRDAAARKALGDYLDAGGTVVVAGRNVLDQLFGKPKKGEKDPLLDRIVVIDRSLGRTKVNYSRAGKKLGEADDIGDWVFTDEGKDVKDLTEKLAKVFQNTKGVARASQKEHWALEPLGEPGNLVLPTAFKHRATFAPKPVWKDGITLVDGDKAAAVVVTDEKFRRLADELVWHVKKMSGRTLEIVKEIPADGSAAIVFKAFDGKNDRAVVRREGNLVYVGGVEAGPSHALTYVLEALGCRYLWTGPTGKVIPKKAKVVLPDISLDWESPFRVRRMRLYDRGIVLDRGGFRDFFQWHGMNDVEGFNDRKPYPCDRWEWGHQYEFYYPKYRKSHPEWFALQPDGTRVLHLGKHTERPTFCLSNMDLVRHIAQEKIAEYKANPTKKALSLCLPDGATSTWCLCEECRKMDPVNAAPGSVTLFWPTRRSEKYVALTDRVYTFMNRIAELVEKECPDLLLSVYAYSCYTAAPVKVRPHKNLLILSVAGHCRSLEGIAEAQNNLAQWQSFGNNLIWRPNMNAGFRANVPQNYARHTFDDLSAMVANGIYGTDFDTMYNEWAAKSIGYYFTARAHLNPDRLDYDTWLRDYCDAGFGAAADTVREYYDYLEQATDAAAALNSTKPIPGVGWEARQANFHRILETLDLDRLDALIAKARAQAAGDAEVLARLDRLDFGNRLGRWTKLRQKDRSAATLEPFRTEALEYLRRDPAAYQASRLFPSSVAKYDIVPPAETNGTQLLAVEELKHHLGRKAQVVPYRFVFARPADAPEAQPFESRYRVKDGTVWFWGDDAGPDASWDWGDNRGVESQKRNGTLFAVETFADRELGMRFIWPGEGGVAVQPVDLLSLRDGAEGSFVTALAKGRIRNYREYKKMPWSPGLQRVMPRELYDGPKPFTFEERALWLKRNRLQDRELFQYGHAFTHWRDRFRETKPELLNLHIDPKTGAQERGYVHGREGSDRTKLCVSNEAVIDQILADWQAEGTPRFVSICENDSGNWCECANCRALDVTKPGEEPYTFLTDRYVNFWNRLAKRARAIRPDVLLTTYIYSAYRYPPRRERIECGDNMLFGFVCGPTEDAMGMIRAWEAAGMKRFFFRPNYLHTLNCIPRGYERFFYNQFHEMLDHGMFGVDYDANDNRYVTAIEFYVLARAFADPKASFASIMDDYASGYGAAADAVKAYYASIREVGEAQRERRMKAHASESEMDEIRRRGFPRDLEDGRSEEELRAKKAILDRALAQHVAAGDLQDDERARLENLVLQAEHAILTFRFMDGIDTLPVDELRRRGEALVEFRLKHKSDLPDIYAHVFGLSRPEGRYWGLYSKRLSQAAKSKGAEKR